MIRFMGNCVVEQFGLDFKSSYQHAFTHIRVLAVKLRNATIAKTKEHFTMIYSWQFYHSLRLWTEVLCTYSDQQDLQLLVYPLVQIITGVLQLLPIQRHYPYHFLCIRLLHQLIASTKLFIPTLPFLLRVLQAPDFGKKLRPSTDKPMDWRVNIRIPNTMLHSRVMFDSVVEQLFELILEYFYLYAYSISFPELAFPALVALKHFVKTTKTPEYAKTFKQLVQQIENGCNFVKTHRTKVDFAPKDFEKADSFLFRYKQDNLHPLAKYYSQQKETREKSLHSDAPGDIFEFDD